MRRATCSDCTYMYIVSCHYYFRWVRRLCLFLIVHRSRPVIFQLCFAQTLDHSWASDPSSTVQITYTLVSGVLKPDVLVEKKEHLQQSMLFVIKRWTHQYLSNMDKRWLGENMSLLLDEETSC